MQDVASWVDHGAENPLVEEDASKKRGRTGEKLTRALKFRLENRFLRSC